MTIEREGEEPITYQVRNSLLTFVVTPDPGNHDLWVIRRIEEAPDYYACTAGPAGSGAAVQPATFGFIKAMFP